MSVRTRFAPSPTGYLHIGGARTALFCWLYARAHAGQFVLRIEDTDRERSTDASVNAILESMDWLGLDYDEGPFYQTKRLDRYREVVQQLLDTGQAYYCYCTPEELQAMREAAMANKEKPRYNGYWRERDDAPPADIKPVVRFKNPLEGSVVFEDAVKGQISVDNRELDDLVIMRSDGMPTYNLTVVVDDHDMQISHVIRGDDHVNNTPRQINILTAMGATLPTYAHLPMILGQDGKRMSKRHGAVSVTQYRDEGYLAEGLLNYLVRLGWSHKDQELFSIDEMVKLFSLDAVNRSGSVFDNDKLAWVNQQHLQKLGDQALAAHLAPQLLALGLEGEHGPKADAVAGILKERSSTFSDMAQQAVIFYRDPAEYDAKAAKKQLTEKSVAALQAVAADLEQQQDWSSDALDSCIQATVDRLEVGFGKVGLPLRVALTGNTQSPPLGQVLSLIGKETALRRINAALTWISQSGGTA